MKYFFILGNNPTLSLAEISAIFDLSKNKGLFVVPNIFILDTEKDIKPTELIKRLGGTIKIGIINDKINPNNQTIINKANDLIDEHNKEGKFKFGFSNYGNQKINLKPIGMEIKKYLKEQSVSCRWITSKEKTLSSVVVEQNKLTSKGIEIVFIPNAENNKEIFIGKTLAVQPFKELSYRDYGRPARDDESGMLPPKLAQIMINLVQAKLEDIILDPFCGSGTIITENLLMGYKNLIGSDVSEKAVADTKKNISWITKNWKLEIGKLEIYQQDSTKLSKIIKPESIDVIVTEPFLGPQRGKIDIKKTVPELEQLYNKSLKEFNKILKANGRVVMIWPIFLKANSTKLNLDLNGFKIIKPLPEYLINNKDLKITPRNTIIYGRQGQKIWREIVVLEKN